MLQKLKKYIEQMIRISPKTKIQSSSINTLGDHLLSILAFFHDRNGIYKSPSELLSSIQDFDFFSHESSPEKIESAIDILPKSFQIHLACRDLTLKEIRSYITASAPVVVFRITENNRVENVYAVEAFTGYSYRVVDLTTKEKSYLREKDLLSLLRTNSISTKIKVLLAEPSATFLNPKKKEDKNDKFFQAIQQIYYLIKLERKDIWIITIYGIGIGILSLVIPVSTSALVNVVTFGVLLQPVIVLTLIVVCIMGFAGLMQVVQTYVIEVLQRRIFVRIALEFSRKFPEIRKDTIPFEHKPELANRFFDSISIQKSINLLLVDGLAVVLTAIIGLTLIATYHPMFLVFDAFILFLGAYLIIYRKGIKIAHQYLDVSKEKYKVAAWLEEISRHDALFHSKHGKGFAYHKMELLMKDYLWVRETFFQKYIKQIIGLISIQTLASGILLGIGGYLVIERQLTIGQLVAAEIVISKVLSDMAKFGKHLESFYSLVASVDKVSTVLNYAEKPTSKIRHLYLEKNVFLKMDELSFTNPLGKKIFENQTFSFSRKRSIGLVCADKETINSFYDLLMGQISPTSGTIQFASESSQGSDANPIQLEISVLRLGDIFAGDILENIRLSHKKASQREVIEILESLGGWEYFQNLPDGLRTKVGTFGFPLGEKGKALLQLARIMLHKPRIVLLDKVLDPLPAPIYKNFLMKLQKEKETDLVLIHSKNQAVLAELDEIVVLDNSDSKRNGQKKGRNGNV